jgi:DNA-binding MarR family transcriptional regulator/ribosomal protein S18 acetylase RimI-like enzyme
VSDRTGLVAEIRRFNRFYTRRIGLLEETLTRSAYTLTEARVLFELGHRRAAAASSTGERAFLAGAFDLNAGPAASEIAGELRLDPAYLTRILRKFGAAGLTEVRTDPADGRRRILSLTAKGEAELAALQAAAEADTAGLIGSLPDDRLPELGNALRTAMELLGGAAERSEAVLRPHRIGDIGWVIERQARLYAEEYGWNDEYEALACEIGAAFLRNFKPGREFCWIAELGGMRAGAVFLVEKSEGVAQLRLLHVERWARGAGIGGRLVAECVETARRAGYSRLVLWTNDVLAGARRLYERAGFRLTGEERHRSFGKDLNGQTWELELDGASSRPSSGGLHE